jgi:peptidoglycan/LPS O-acetylase OafA/YrhL
LNSSGSSPTAPAQHRDGVAPLRAQLAPAETAPTYRPFLDGLRAVAILGVLVYHLDRDWLPGGFLGVDIFFVLSGYLITMLLLAEQRQTGRIHLPSFWARRIRRLLPALLVMLVVMAVLIDLRGDPLVLGQARGDLLSTLFYFANWHFISTGQSYFAQFVAVSPDRHTWSLAIEEQFYLVWPIVVALILARFRPRTLAVVAATVAVASALWMVVLFDPADPSRAYYGTDSRIFEILIGTLLAIGMAGPLRDRIGRVGRRVAPAALVALVAAFALLADDNGFYYHGGAVLVCLAAAGLLAGLEAGSPIDRLLSVRPMVLIGLVSYGMYLWHFPIITFVNEWFGPTSLPAGAALATGLTLAATAISYVVVERPIRRRGMLFRLKLTPSRLARIVPVASGAVALVIVATTLGAVENPIWDAAGNVNAITIATPGPAAALATAADGSPASPNASAPSAGPAATSIGGPGWTIGAVGDSVMVSMGGALQKEATDRGWRFVSAAEAACPVGYQQLYQTDGTTLASCSNVRTLHQQLLATKPDVILWHDLQSSLARRSPTGALLQPGTKAWETALLAEWTSVLDDFLASGAQVVILLPPLRSQQVAGCGAVADQTRCEIIQSEDTNIRRATNDFFADLNGRAGVYLIEVDSLLCPAGYPCPGYVDGVQVRFPGYDQTHFTAAGAAWFAPQLLDRVMAAIEGRADPGASQSLAPGSSTATGNEAPSAPAGSGG